MENNLKNDVLEASQRVKVVENTATEDAAFDSIDASNVTYVAIEPIKKRRKPVGGIIAGIFNILFMGVSAICFGAFTYFIGVGYYSVYTLNNVTMEGFDGLGPALAIAIAIAYGAICGGAYLVSTLPSLPYFIVARFNRSKFFKISTIIISCLHAIGCGLVIFTYAIFVLGVKFGWFI